MKITGVETLLLILKIGLATTPRDTVAPPSTFRTTDLSETIRNMSCHCSVESVTSVSGSWVRIITLSLVDLLFWGGVSLFTTSNDSSIPIKKNQILNTSQRNDTRIIHQSLTIISKTIIYNSTLINVSTKIFQYTGMFVV